MNDRRKRALELLKETNKDTSLDLGRDPDPDLKDVTAYSNGDMWIAPSRHSDQSCAMCQAGDQQQEYVHFDNSAGEYGEKIFCLECLTGIRDVLADRMSK